MIQVYADDARVWNIDREQWLFQNDMLIYDSRLEEYDLVGLKVTTGLNVGGTAEIVMPSSHPAYRAFQPFKTLVRIYRDGVLRFRGRVLYPADNFLGQRTITCEGELCLLRDSINRPYLYEASPRSIFVTIINAHNGQTDVAKRFTVGDVTVVDTNDYVRLESESAETILDTLNKAVERVGGYITFTDAEDGTRVINWLESLDNKSGQVIEFGENLLDFSSTGANTTELATGLVPYGAKDETTKKRLTIETVNDGKDYIMAGDAVYERGTIMATAVWDDVTTATNLLAKARACLEERKLFITSLELTALDLSYMDKSIDNFTVGDVIRVVSAPHGVNEDFQLTKMTEDLMNPAQSKITLGKDIPSLTGADVAGDRKGQEGLNAVRTEVSTSLNMSSYATKDDLKGYATTDQLSGYAVKSDLTGYLKKDDLTGYDSEMAKLEKRIAGQESMLTEDETAVNLGKGTKNLRLHGIDVYLKSSVVVVQSDRIAQNSIEELPDAYVEALDKMTPVRFKYNDGTSDRYHVGFIAQDVVGALTYAGLSGKDFGGFVDLNGEGETMGMAYDEFIGLLLQKIRRLEQKIEVLEEKQ